MRGKAVDFYARASARLLCAFLGVAIAVGEATADRDWGGIEESVDISVATMKREFQKAALILAANLNGLYPEIEGETPPCEDAIKQGRGDDIRSVCSAGDAATPLALSIAAIGHLAQGQFFAASKSIQRLGGAESNPGVAALKRHMVAKYFDFSFAILDDRALGGPAVAERMQAFDAAILLAESRQWQESCAALDRDMATFPDFRTIHLLRFVICARAGTDRSVELRSYAAMADPTAQVFAAFLLGEFPSEELLLRIKDISPFADWYVERHFYTAEMAYLSGDQAAYRSHLQKVLGVKEVRLFEHRLAIAESQP